MVLHFGKQVGRSLLVVVMVTIAVVGLLSFAPGSVGQIILGESATPEAVAELNSRLGLDEPVWRRYLDEVGVPDPERRLRNYPHEMSGGMRQRVMIAIALSCEPELLIADEPTTALDVTIQRQILDLLRNVQRDRHTSMMLISHDLAVVAGRTDRVSVMYAGRLAEIGSTRQVFDAPRHRYTAALLGATPTIDHPRHTPLRLIAGSLPDPVDPPAGCRFAPRCASVVDLCTEPGPDMESFDLDHRASCVNPVGKRTLASSGGRL